MKLVLDVEVTTHSDGSPFNSANSLVCIGWYDGTKGGVVKPDEYLFIQSLVNQADLIIGFNFKFDYHWLKKIGINLKGKKFYDCQIAEYILSHQHNTFPSLDDTAFKLLGKKKLDVVKTEYWDKGINTTGIPWEILSEYCYKDCQLTYEVYEQLVKNTPNYQKTIISLAMQDMLVLQEMEWNGSRFNREQALIEEEKALKRKNEILEKLFNTTKVPEQFNFASPKQLSALLYGGKIPFTHKVPNGVWKSGQREGQVKFKNVTNIHIFPRLYTPVKGTESAEKGVWSTGEDALTKLGKEGIVADILEIRAIDKLVGTYLRKLPAMQDENNWGKQYIYGQFGQTTTATGRLASSKPNLQNMAPEANKLIITRYE